MHTRTAILLSVALAACTSKPRAPAVIADDHVAPHGVPLMIELLGFEGCPNTPTLKARIGEAVRDLAMNARISYVDQESLDPNDIRRGWPAPTLLVSGEDLFGMPAPSSPAPGCRMYPAGVPSVAELAGALRTFVNSRTSRSGSSAPD